MPRTYTVTPDRPKNVPNSSERFVRQHSGSTRVTGTGTTVLDGAHADAAGVIPKARSKAEAAKRWVVKCEEHGTYARFATLLEARRIAFLPNLWCRKCAVDHPVEVVGTAPAYTSEIAGNFPRQMQDA